MIMIAIFILLSISTIALIVLGLLKDEDAFACGFLGFIALLITTVVGVGIFGDKPKPYPTAIDVYRDNTTLEITYRDSVAVDSIVVWKEG